MYLGLCAIFLGFVVVVDRFDSSFVTLFLLGLPAGTVFHT